MTSPPDEQIREALAAYAADAVEGAERVSIARHLQDCPLCRAEVAAYRETLSLLVPSSEPPGDRLGLRVAARLDPSEQRRSSVRGRRRRPRRSTLALASTGALVALAATVVAAFLLVGRGGLGPPAEVAALVPDGRADVAERATLYRPNAPDGVLVLDLTRIAPPPPGRHYEVWVLRRRSPAAMEAVGSFSLRGRSVRLRLPLLGAGRYRALDISVQQDGGPATHSRLSVASARFG